MRTKALMAPLVGAALFMCGRSPADSPKLPEVPRLLFTRAEIEKRLADPEDPLHKLESLIPEAMSMDPSLVDRQYIGQTQMQNALMELGLVYQVTGKGEQAARALALVKALAEKDFPYWGKEKLGNSDIGGSNLFLGIALAMDCCASAWPAQDRRDLAVRYQTAVLDWREKVLKRHHGWNGRSNHTAVSASGMGMAALLLDGEPGSDPKAVASLLADARAQVPRTFPLFSPHGAYPSDHSYCHYHLSSSLPFAFALKRRSGEDLLEGTAVREAARWVPYVRIPGTRTGAFFVNDSSDRLPMGNGWAFLGALCAPEDPFIWMVHDAIGDPHRAPFMALCLPRRTEKTSPDSLPLCRLFEGRQVAYFRTSFTDPEATAAVFEVRGKEAMGEHQQFDLNSFSIHGLGTPFAIDSGYANPWEKLPNARCSYPDAHNSVVIDGQGMETQWSSKKQIWGDLLGFAWAPGGFAGVGGSSAPYWEIERASRFFLMAPRGGAPYFVVGDRLKKEGGDHRFTWCWQSGRGLKYSWEGNRARVQAAPGRPAMEATFLAPEGPFDFVADEMPYRKDEHPAHPRLRVTPKRESPEADFLVVLDIQGEGVPGLTIEPLEVTGGLGVRIRCAQEGFEDWVVLSTSLGEVRAKTKPPLQTDAFFAAVRLPAGEGASDLPRPLAVFGIGGTFLKWKGEQVVSVKGKGKGKSGSFSATDERAACWSREAGEMRVQGRIEEATWNQRPAKLVRENGRVRCQPSR